MQFERCFGGLTGTTIIPVSSATATVAPAAFHQQTSREKDGVGGLQLFSQVHRVVARSTAVPLDIVVKPVQINLTIMQKSIKLINDHIFFPLALCFLSRLTNFYNSKLPSLFLICCVLWYDRNTLRKIALFILCYTAKFPLTLRLKETGQLLLYVMIKTNVWDSGGTE